ncbi:MAG: chromosomal replication initiator protein DnaA [Acidimicrobiia bacterium]|nr:chromosomal replication initiator protein DnaA [Acidimicrobiia bacterium]
MSQAITTEWDLFRDTVRSKVSPVTWQTWLAALEDAGSEPSVLRLSAPSEFHLRWVVDKHLDVLSETARRIWGPDTELDLTAAAPSNDWSVDEDEFPEVPAQLPATIPIPEPDRRSTKSSRLLARYTFDHFVVGPSNRFAHAAAMAVAEQPGRHYNPLFIYGAAGLGKTHLLNAVGHHALELNPTYVVRYVSSENFFNEFIDGIRRKRMDEFKDRYRTIDVLLLDDVQFFEGKEQILEEFFHTFNSLYESGKQMVLSSDRHPRNLATLEDRLRSRFEWGLLTDIQAPDVETRLAILRKNTEGSSHEFPEPVLEFIAQHVEDNIRELEGALTRVTAYATLHLEVINLAMAQDVLQDLVPAAAARPVTAADILGTTASSFGFSTEEVCGPSRRAPLVRARQIGMYLVREHTNLSLPKIGALFGNRDHTTVMYAIEKVKGLMKTDHEVFDQVTALSQNLRITP